MSETETPITPEFIANPANAAHLRERANNTTNVNDVPTTNLPVKSQAVTGPTADPAIAERVADGTANVNPGDGPGGQQTFDIAATLSGHFASSYVVAVRHGHAVNLQGELVVTSPTADETVFTFPPAFRPEHDVTIPIFKTSGSGQGMLALDHETGVVTWKTGTAGTYTLAGITIVD